MKKTKKEVIINHFLYLVAAAGLMTIPPPPDKILDAQYHNQHINNMIYLIIYRGEKN